MTDRDEHVLALLVELHNEVAERLHHSPTLRLMLPRADALLEQLRTIMRPPPCRKPVE